MAYLLPSGRWREQIRKKDFGYYKGAFDTEAEALQWKQETLATLSEKKAKERGQGKALSDVIDEYLKSAKFLRKAPGTQRREKSSALAILNIRSERTKLVRRDWATRQIDLIDVNDLDEYIAQRMTEVTIRGNPVSNDSIRLEVRFLSPVFKLAVRKRYRTTNPTLARASGLELPRGLPREGRISETEELRLSAIGRNHTESSTRANECFSPWLEFTRKTLCRPGEAAKVELSWINLESKCVDVPRRGSKKRNPRRIILTDDLVELVTAQMACARRVGSPYLFYSLTRATGEWQPYQYSSAWRRTRKLADVKVEAHGMRREGISRFFERSSLTDGQIALLVGDVNPMSLEPYKHLRSEELRPQMEAFGILQKERTDRAEASNLKLLMARLGINSSQLPPELNAWMDGGVKPAVPGIDGDRLPVPGSKAKNTKTR
jgi:integrase